LDELAEAFRSNKWQWLGVLAFAGTT